MAEAVSDSEAARPPPKRRRILDPSAIVSVPVYSSKVSSSLQLKPAAAAFTQETADDSTGDVVWSQFSSRGTSAAVTLSDSEEEDDEAECVEKRAESEAVCCPSPPPPLSPVQKQSRRVRQKISEIDRKLQAVNSLLSPGPQNTRTGRCKAQDCPYSSSVREISLKVRCRTDVHKIPVLTSAPLSDVLARLSVILKVPPPRLLLLREEVELPADSSVGELGLGITDIIECVVMAAKDGRDSGGVVTVRLQSRDRDASQEFSLHRDAPLGSIFSQYLSSVSAAAGRAVRFLFDGCRVTHSQTPAQLDMEDGDIIEVWT